ncbi:MAG: aminomethyl-transferring glycine dehydrogenase subunit GcvPB [Clostridiaceae bacterium]|nr:aminomethyl-transferring glycine dehydrogenase subunit GcvPB [Clostridiaceae bacterium]
MIRDEKLIFEKSVEGRIGYSLPENDVPKVDLEAFYPDEFLRKTDPELPEVSEVDVIRHYTNLSKRNYGVDSGFYPLGSCTMKYNPKINEDIASIEGLAQMHPLQDPQSAQGNLEILYNMDRYLSEILGMERVTLQPAAGAHGEMTGLMIIKAYHMHRNDSKRVKIIVPDSSHGTNPASAALAGFEVVHIPSDERGCVDIKALESILDDTVAGLMLTNPNTLGLFEEDILKISKMVHACGGLLYYDGANMNAIMGIARPGDMGFDIAHVNLHKTFSTPHGGGGPGSGPIGVIKELVPFLPVPVIEKVNDSFVPDYDRPLSIGKVKSFYGNFGVILRAYSYIRTMGAQGLKAVSQAAVLNANYIRKKLEDYYEIPYNRTCMHEFVLSAQKQAKSGVTALDIAKNLLDEGIHPPTIYFPLIVQEAMMIEPTETESPETLDNFIEIMRQLAVKAQDDPESLKNAPKTTYVSRLDEVKAARTPVLRWKK